MKIPRFIEATKPVFLGANLPESNLCLSATGVTGATGATGAGGGLSTGASWGVVVFRIALLGTVFMEKIMINDNWWVVYLPL